MKRRQAKTEQRFDVKVLTRRVHVLVTPNGLCPRREARMLPAVNSEQQSTPRSRVYAMSVLRLLSARYYNVVSRLTLRGKHPKQIKEEKKNGVVALK